VSTAPAASSAARPRCSRTASSRPSPYKWAFTLPFVINVARLLLDWCDVNGTVHLPGSFDGGLPLSLLADVVGSTRPTVNRTWLALERAGDLVLEHGGITVEDFSAVRRRAQSAGTYMHGVSARRSDVYSVDQRNNA